MSTPAQSIADIISDHGGPTGDMQVAMKEIEAVKQVRFGFHPWMNLPNLGPDTFRFNVPYPELKRLEPIAIWTVQRPHIHEQRRGSLNMLGVSTYVGTGDFNAETAGAMGRGFGDSSGYLGMVPSGGGAKVTRIPQKPDESIRDLLQAWTHVGFTELRSLAAADEAELLRAYDIYEAVAGIAANEEEEQAGRRPADLVLEEFLQTPFMLDLNPAAPRGYSWLERGAPRALEYALSKGVRGKAVGGAQSIVRKLPPGSEAIGLRLIEEMRESVFRAHQFALDPANGVLPKTRTMMQTAKSGGEGKRHFDEQDLWLLREFPGFPMDTDVDRAQRAVTASMERGNDSANATGEGLLALAKQNQELITMFAEERKEMKALIKAALGKKGKAGEEDGQ